MQNLLAGLFLLGIVIAGSDGTWFPWINIGGLTLSAITVVIINRIYTEREENHDSKNLHSWYH